MLVVVVVVVVVGWLVWREQGKEGREGKTTSCCSGTLACRLYFLLAIHTPPWWSDRTGGDGGDSVGGWGFLNETPKSVQFVNYFSTHTIEALIDIFKGQNKVLSLTKPHLQ